MRNTLHVTQYVIAAKSRAEATELAKSHEEDMMHLSTIEETSAGILTEFVYTAVSIEEMSSVSNYYESKIHQSARLL